MDEILHRLQKSVVGDELIIDYKLSDVLSAIFECQQELPVKLYQLFSKSKISIGNMFHPLDIRNVSFLVTQVPSMRVTKISIENINNKKLPDNITILFKMFFDSNCESIVRIKMEEVMRVCSDTTSDVKTILFCLPPDGYEQHEDILRLLLTTNDIKCFFGDLFDKYFGSLFNFVFPLLLEFSTPKTLVVLSVSDNFQANFQIVYDTSNSFDMIINLDMRYLKAFPNDDLVDVMQFAFKEFQTISFPDDVVYNIFQELIILKQNL